MPPSYVPLAVKASGMIAHDTVPDFVAKGGSLRDSLYLSTLFRRMGAGFLLMNGISTALHKHLSFSGWSFAHWLSLATEERQSTAQAMPFLDAIAAKDRPCAQAIADRSRRTWNPDLEYEDDFLYMHFLMEMFVRGADPDALQAVLDRYEEVLEGARDCRFDVCRAFLRKEQPAFDMAVQGLVELLQKRLSDLDAKERLNGDEAATTAHVSSELCAWLLLGAERGFRIGRNYPMSPDLARMGPPADPSWAQSWTSIPSYRDLS